MSAPKVKVDAPWVLAEAAATFDNIRFERRHESTELQTEFWSRRIAEALEARAAVVELIALRNRVARLNPDAGEIGAGMLAQLVAEARRIGGA